MKVGDQIRHIKRNSVYRIIDSAKLQAQNVVDGTRLKLVSDMIGAILRDEAHNGGWSVTAQISDEKNMNDDWIIYRTTNRPPNLFFARPASEFTPDRFELLGA